MTSPLDVAVLVPAVAAAVQAAAVVVQMYWDRRQHTAETTQKPAALRAMRSRRNGSQAVLVQVRVCPETTEEVAVSVRIGGSAGGMALPPSGEDGRW